MAVQFFKADVSQRISKSNLLSKFISKRFQSTTKKSLFLSCVLCSDDYLLDINKKFLQHDFYTDIITFPLEESLKKAIAEIYISVDRVADNAQRNKTTYENEFQRVLFHGVLHLCGYGDKTKQEKIKMTEMENLWLRSFEKFYKSNANS